MISSFHLYTASAIISLYGFFLFLWWWKKTGKASEIYILVTILFMAHCVEKGFFTWLGWHVTTSTTDNATLYHQIINHPLWWTVALPTTAAFFLIVFVMTNRIYRSNRALKQIAAVVKPPSLASRSVLCISNKQETRTFMQGVFAMAQVEYTEAESVINGLESLVANECISIVLVGLNAIEEANLQQTAVVKMVKKERPWAIVVAMTRQPNLYELAEARRSFFDDYLYLPIRAGVMQAHFERWMTKVTRWKRLDFYERRKYHGTILHRKGIRVRQGPNGSSVHVECTGYGNGDQK